MTRRAQGGRWARRCSRTRRIFVGAGSAPPLPCMPFMVMAPAACMTLVMLPSTVTSMGMGALLTGALIWNAGVGAVPPLATADSSAHTTVTHIARRRKQTHTHTLGASRDTPPPGVHHDTEKMP